MKKIFILLIIPIFLLTSCTINKNEPIELDKSMDINITTYKDNNPITVGLYEGSNLIKEYNTTLVNMKDIAVFSIYYTQEEKLTSSNTKYNWNKYYQNYQNIDNYKIGFNLSFTTNDKIYNQTFLDPTCEYLFSPYIYIYLYDDINQPDGAWYSHVLDTEVNDNTIYSSIKLFMASNATEITSPITLTVFTYDDDDFNEEGAYIGKSSYTITINTK